MREVKHTPTPWKVYQCGGVQIGQEGTGEAICSMWGDKHEGEANAAHIVKCVNMHDELVGALKECAEAFNLHAEQYPHMVKGFTLDAFNAAYETIKKAGAL